MHIQIIQRKIFKVNFYKKNIWIYLLKGNTHISVSEYNWDS